ncbi:MULTISPECIES: RHS repeat domain-containing protein, partial [Elizabethkingia]
GTLRRYSYEYDGVNRLKAGNYWDNSGTANGSYAERLNYDLNGNITGLRRTGLGAGLMDELGYSYDQAGNSNKLIRVSDASGNAAGYPVGGNVIGYDVNGNMVNHLDKGISSITYNYLNLPSSINASIGNTDYVYRADGVKLKKVFGAKTTDYLDGFQYENGVLQFVPTAEGYFDVTKNRYIYNYTDHLGNVRLSYTKGASGGAEIIEENNYYPFGLKHEGYNNASLASSAYQYKYNGKELQETGMYDYGARMYMPDIGRWGVVDPLAEKMTRHSPYNYAFNNPIRFIDPDGRANQDIIKILNNGTIERTKTEDNFDIVTNEDGSSSYKVEHLNGDSQIGDVKTFTLPLEGEGGLKSDKFSFLQINNADIATQFFEFASNNSSKEFSHDKIDFPDGFSSNLITTNYLQNAVIGANELLPNLDLGNGRIIKDGTWSLNAHSHPESSGSIAPSGFTAYKNNGDLKFSINPLHGNSGDRNINQPSGLTRYMYSPILNKKLGGGYIKYNNKTATYVGKNKKDEKH